MHQMQEREASIKKETADLKLLLEANTALGDGHRHRDGTPSNARSLDAADK
jgi:hypothetical protein